MNSTRYTTDLDILIDQPHLFTWGKIENFYHLENYIIGKYIPRPPAKEKLLYHCWVNRKSIHVSATSLESAIFSCIAYAKLGPNSQAAEFMTKMIQ